MKNTTIQLNGGTYYGQTDGKYFYFNEFDRLEMGVDKIEISEKQVEAEEKKPYTVVLNCNLSYTVYAINKEEAEIEAENIELPPAYETDTFEIVKIYEGDEGNVRAFKEKKKAKKISAREKIFLPEDAELLCDSCIVVWDGKKIVFKGASTDANFYYKGQEVLFDYDGDPYIMEEPVQEPLDPKEPKKKPSMVEEEMKEEIKEEEEQADKETTEDIEEVVEEVREEEEPKQPVKKVEEEMEVSDIVKPDVEETARELDKSVEELARIKKEIE